MINLMKLGKLLSEYVTGVLILNSKQEIIWTNDYIEKICNRRQLLNRKVSDVFYWNLSHLEDDIKIKDQVLDKTYHIKSRNFEINEMEYSVILVEEINTFANKDTKLFCLEKIIESIYDGVVVSDYEGRVVLYNKSQESLENLSAGEVLGKYLWEAYNYDAKEMSEHRKVYNTGIPVINKYKAHAYKDGIPKYVSYNTYPIQKDGETIAVYSISKNETKLQTLLAETLELKRKLYSKGTKKEDISFSNGTSFTFAHIVGNSGAMKNLIREAQTISSLGSNILIVGETGTGKEVLAQSIHNFGKNPQEPFVAINCGAIPENLLESILFGTEKGSYTGAVNKAGLFEEAKNGTLFLDEMNSMPISMQTKLLRVLQDKKVRRVGGLNTIPVHCRVISAINEDPYELIRQGRFRQDLFYRVAGFSLYILPLRERKEDILSMAEFFINKYNDVLSRKIKTLSKELTEIMLTYNWPGNARELEHVIENLMVRAEEDQLELMIKNIPLYLKKDILGANAISSIEREDMSLPNILRDVEKRVIIESLNKNNWNISETSRDLGIIRQSLIYRIKKLGIEKEV